MLQRFELTVIVALWWSRYISANLEATMVVD